jgi:hypothetical protein
MVRGPFGPHLTALLKDIRSQSLRAETDQKILDLIRPGMPADVAALVEACAQYDTSHVIVEGDFSLAGSWGSSNIRATKRGSSKNCAGMTLRIGSGRYSDDCLLRLNGYGGYQISCSDYMEGVEYERWWSLEAMLEDLAEIKDEEED